MNFRMSQNHLYVRTKDGRGFKMSLDAAEKLRAFLEKNLYRKEKPKSRSKLGGPSPATT